MKKLGVKPHERKDFLNDETKMTRGDISDIMNLEAKNIDYDEKKGQINKFLGKAF